MGELSFNFRCPKCHKWQGRVLRFKEDIEDIDNTMLIKRLKRIRFNCLYCKQLWTWKKVRESKEGEWSILNIKDNKTITPLKNMDEIKRKLGL